MGSSTTAAAMARRRDLVGNFVFIASLIDPKIHDEWYTTRAGISMFAVAQASACVNLIFCLHRGYTG